MKQTRAITIEVVKAINPGEIIWDTKVVGFAVRRQKSEARTYVVKTRVNNQQRWFTIGRHGSPWTPEKARREAQRLLGSVAEGHDLSSIRDENKAAMTMGALCDLYLSEAEAGKILTKFGEPKKASTISTDRGRIERHIKPLLGKKLVKNITTQDVKRFMHDVAIGKTATDVKTGLRGRAIVEGGRGTATRTVGLLGGILSYAINNGMRPDETNPVHGVKRYPDKKEDRFLSLVEFGKLGEAMTSAEDDGEGLYGLAGIRLLMLTGCRKSEILTLKWDHVDFENTCLRLPDSKTGEKVIMVGAPTLGVLSSLPRIKNNPYVLPGKKVRQHLVGLPKVWGRIKAKAGLEWATLHILRHSFASYGAGSGLGLPIIGKLLGHKDATTTARYAKVDLDPARVAANRISEGIASAMNNNRGGAEVVPHHKREDN
ncbi:MAG: tyrosine-type recombinase/integrase [Rhodospirillaceae bacterium]|nr:tyrosine-type recombinase/integrase [Rhodospirillaceae bacterium]